MSGNSIIDFGELSKPATVLIEKISGAIGVLYEPIQIKRIARAESEAMKIRFLAESELSELSQRALQRFIGEETKKQNIIESITSKSLPLLDDKSRPENIDDDWIVNFFDKCRIVSDSEMQDIWSRVLAGEVNSPGKFSKRTINFMASLDKNDAIIFTKLCSFNWLFGDSAQPLIYDVDALVYKNNGINFSSLKHLDAIGLISFESLTGYNRRGFLQTAAVSYGGMSYLIKFPKENDNELSVGKVLLTSIGEEISSICNPEIIPDFINYVIEEFTKNGITTSSFIS